MMDSRTYLRVLGVMIFVVALQNYEMAVYGFELIAGASAHGTSMVVAGLGVLQILAWALTLIASILLFRLHWLGKWALFVLFMLGALGLTWWASWIPGIGLVTPVTDSMTLNAFILQALNGALVLLAFWLSRRGGLRYRPAKSSHGHARQTAG